MMRLKTMKILKTLSIRIISSFVFALLHSSADDCSRLFEETSSNHFSAVINEIDVYTVQNSLRSKALEIKRRENPQWGLQNFS
jgi:hypothetical protein